MDGQSGFAAAIFNGGVKQVICRYMQRFLTFPDANRFSQRNLDGFRENRAKVTLDNRSSMGIKCLPAQW
jgi:hypothetical protein